MITKKRQISSKPRDLKFQSLLVGWHARSKLKLRRELSNSGSNSASPASRPEQFRSRRHFVEIFVSDETGGVFFQLKLDRNDKNGFFKRSFRNFEWSCFSGLLRTTTISCHRSSNGSYSSNNNSNGNSSNGSNSSNKSNSGSKSNSWLIEQWRFKEGRILNLASFSNLETDRLKQKDFQEFWPAPYFTDRVCRVL